MYETPFCNEYSGVLQQEFTQARHDKPHIYYIRTRIFCWERKRLMSENVCVYNPHDLSWFTDTQAGTESRKQWQYLGEFAGSVIKHSFSCVNPFGNWLCSYHVT